MNTKKLITLLEKQGIEKPKSFVRALKSALIFRAYVAEHAEKIVNFFQGNKHYELFLKEVIDPFIQLHKGQGLVFEEEKEKEKKKQKGRAKQKKKSQKVKTKDLYIAQTMSRLFFTEKDVFAPEFATFFDVTKLLGVKGIKIGEDNYWRTVEHYYQAMKLDYLKVENKNIISPVLFKIFRQIKSPQKIFDFVREKITLKSIRRLLRGVTFRRGDGGVDRAQAEASLLLLKASLKKDINHSIDSSWHDDKNAIMDAIMCAKYQIEPLKARLLYARYVKFHVEGNRKDYHWGMKGRRRKKGKKKARGISFGDNYLGWLTTRIALMFWSEKLPQIKREHKKRKKRHKKKLVKTMFPAIVLPKIHRKIVDTDQLDDSLRISRSRLN
jgi:predicted NAD-dependent protein-ADP-ribosyltransferase YbiA (DUF1768 family)